MFNKEEDKEIFGMIYTIIKQIPISTTALQRDGPLISLSLLDLNHGNYLPFKSNIIIAVNIPGRYHQTIKKLQTDNQQPC